MTRDDRDTDDTTVPGGSGGVMVLPVAGIGDVAPGADLAAVLLDAAPWLADGDIVVLTSKVVSKAEGRLLRVPPDEPAREAARQAAITAEAVRVVAERGPTRIVQTRHGLVLASAGIDASNVDAEHLVLLPEDPDASARALRAEIRERYGRDVAVVVTDTMGRPWRLGLTDVAIGAAGIAPVRDYRGERDAYGNELQLTQMAVVDELAAAGELVKGKYDQVPVAVVRGLPALVTPEDGPGAAALVRDAESDLFSMGTAEARAAGARAVADLAEADTLSFGSQQPDPDVLASALAVAPGAMPAVPGPAERDKLASAIDGLDPGGAELLVPCTAPDPVEAARRGAGVHRIRARLAAAGLASAWLPVPADLVEPLVPVPAGMVPLGLLVVGHPH